MTPSTSTSSTAGLRLSRAARALAALAFAATAAAPALATSITLAPAGSGLLAGSFVQAANGLVIDDFSVAPMTFGSTFTVALASVSGPVSFFTAAFFPDTPAEIDYSNLTDAVGGPFSFTAPVAAGQPVSFRVFGAVTDAMGNLGGNGSYSVSVTAAVPEPQTWALLLAGLAGVGWAARRRRG